MAEYHHRVIVFFGYGIWHSQQSHESTHVYLLDTIIVKIEHEIVDGQFDGVIKIGIFYHAFSYAKKETGAVLHRFGVGIGRGCRTQGLPINGSDGPGDTPDRTCLGRDLGLALAADLDLGTLGDLGLFGQLVGYRIACITGGDTLLGEELQGLELGHGLGQLHEVDIGAAGLVKDLDASYQIVGETGLDGAV